MLQGRLHLILGFELNFFKMWQDYLITVVSLIFAYALIPQVIQGFKHKKGYINFQTALFNTIGMYLVVIAYSTLNLWLSTIIGTFNATMWLLLLIQKIIYK
ncbi:MAG TPA: hypothetical protein VJ438_01000 [Candidatus Nanoarchaeia archaeon]|nr:hypothetical protein [Candidatus Nanoarchaeia archaeon]